MTRTTIESFYDSPPNFSLTKSPFFKPAPGRTSWNTVPLTTPTSLFDSPLQTRKITWRPFIYYQPSSKREAMKRSLKKIAGFGWVYRRISLLIVNPESVRYRTTAVMELDAVDSWLCRLPEPYRAKNYNFSL